MSFLNEIKNVVINRATQRINSALGGISSLGDGMPRRSGGVLPTEMRSLAPDPFEGKSIVYPENLGSNEASHYVQFFINEQSNANIDFGLGTGFEAPSGNAQGSTLSVQRSATKRLKSSIAMYMPAQVSTSSSSKYGEHEIGAFAAAGINAYKAAMGADGGMDAAGKIFQSAKGSIKEAAPEALKAAADVAFKGTKASMDIMRGKVTNNRMEMLFEGVDRRNFSFSFKMMPKSSKESMDVKTIVDMFRFYMAPSFDGAVSTSRTFIVPATFDIQYMNQKGQNNYLNKISTCVLTSCNVTYGGERVQFFRPDEIGSAPVETNIELSFRELEVITRERISEGF
jgi:hypothetical protein